jgi:hypothetical protein
MLADLSYVRVLHVSLYCIASPRKKFVALQHGKSVIKCDYSDFNDCNCNLGVNNLVELKTLSHVSEWYEEVR